MSTASRGHEYELNVAKHLKKFEYVPAGFTPAASENRPDLKVQNERGSGGCELKISTKVGAGSVNFTFDKGRWRFDTASKLPEQLMLINVAKRAGFFTLLGQKWKGNPLKRTPMDRKWEMEVGKMTREQMYRHDLAQFPSFSFPVRPQIIEKYYLEKNAHYINIGTHGLYVLGTIDPLGMNKSLRERKMKLVPRFANVANVGFTVQVKNKGAGKWYQFMIEGRFNIPISKKSPYNLGATNGESAAIVESQTDLSCFL